MFFGLSYLPPEKISGGFCDLMYFAFGTNSSVISIFSDYILENYIKADTNFHPTLRVCEFVNNPKTTNGAESFHRHYNSQFYIVQPHIHQVINIIVEIQEETDI